MRPLNVRRGAWAGSIVAMVGAFAAAARSAAPLSAFVETAAVGLLAVVLVIGVALGINRRRARPPEARVGLSLEVQRAVLVGGLMGVVVEAMVSARTSAPLLTFASNLAVVLWMALLAVGVLIVVERLKTARRLGR